MFKILSLILFIPQFVMTKIIAPKEYNISLDINPENRWDGVIEDNIDNLHYIDSYLDEHIPIKYQKYTDYAGKIASSFFSEEYLNELNGIARKINSVKSTNLTFGNIVMLNLAYELSVLGKKNYHPNYPPPSRKYRNIVSNKTSIINNEIGCTSILAYTENDTLIHSRNMDWDLKELKKLLIQVNFIKNKNMLYKGITVVGYIGIITGINNNFSITLNARNFGGSLFLNFWDFMIRHATPVTLLSRAVLEKNNYFDAKKILINSTITAPVYYSVGYKTEGVIITRDRKKMVDIMTLTPNNSNNWYILETNYDNWKPPPYNDSRRYYAIDYMNKIGKNNIDIEPILNTMMKYPIKNNNTCYTSIMIPDNGNIVTYLYT